MEDAVSDPRDIEAMRLLFCDAARFHFDGGVKRGDERCETACPFCQSAAKDAIAALDAAREQRGLVVVPKRETDEMASAGAVQGTTIQIGNQAMSGPIGEWPARNTWRAMIAARPKEG